MKRVLRQITLGAILFLAMSSLVACLNPILESRVPLNFADSRWESEDGSITFTVVHIEGYGNTAIGRMVVEGEVIEFTMYYFYGGWQELYYFKESDLEPEPNQVIDGQMFETWHCNYTSKKRFVATVVTTTYFEIDQKIVFHRVDEE